MHDDPDLHEIVEWLNLYLEEYSRHPVPAQFKISFLKRSYCAWRLLNLDDTNNKKLNPQICAQIQILDFMSKKLDLSISGNREHVVKIITTVEEIQPYQATLDQFNRVFNNLESNNESFELFLNTNLWVQVRRALESVNQIRYDGIYRGRTYWHKQTRPRITTIDIAQIIQKILASDGNEKKWGDIYPILFSALSQIHNYAEGPMHHLELDSSELEGGYFAFVIPEPMPVDYEGKRYQIIDIPLTRAELYKGPYALENIDLWLKNTYTDDWFADQASAIQVHFRGRRGNVDIARGSLRGFWTTSTNSRVTNRGKRSGLYKSLANISEEYERIKRRFNSPEDKQAIGQALEALLRDLRG